MLSGDCGKKLRVSEHLSYVGWFFRNITRHTALRQLVLNNEVVQINLRSLVLPVAFCFLISCSKNDMRDVDSQRVEAVVDTPSYILYRIPTGAHYCTGNEYRKVSYQQLRFMIKFDSSAIYTSHDPHNQDDINKLYGFSDDNTHHHFNSARFGWRWSKGALRLFAYTYNKGTLAYQELNTVMIGKEYACSISVNGNQYLFAVDHHITVMPRSGTTVNGEGYQLYPYFGGDESAPHDIQIAIKEY